MTRILTVPAVLALLSGAGCGPDVAQCGGCLGPSYRLTGLATDLHPSSVTACIADLPCTRVAAPAAFRSDYLQPLGLPPHTRASALDGETLRVSVEAGGLTSSGWGKLRWREGEGTCGCDELHADVDLTRVGRVAPPSHGAGITAE